MVGRPNAGKSTLVNRLLGEERLLTGPEAGITRDAIAVDLQLAGPAPSASTTPPACGAARRSQEKLEKLSVADALNAIRFAEVVVLLMDARAAVRGAGPAHRRPGRARGPRAGGRHEQMGPGENAGRRVNELREQADHWLPQLKGVPVVGVSGLTGEGLDRLMQAVIDDPRGLEQARRDRGAQPLARGCRRGASAARACRAAG